MPLAMVAAMVSGEALACSPPPPPPPGETAEQTGARRALEQRQRDDWDRDQVLQSRVVYVGRIVSVRAPQPEDATQTEGVVVVAPTDTVLHGRRPPRRLSVADAFTYLCGPRYAAVPRAEDVGREVLIVLGSPRLGPDHVQELVFLDSPAAKRLMSFATGTTR